MSRQNKALCGAVLGLFISNMWWGQPFGIVHEIGHIMTGGGGIFLDINHVAVRNGTVFCAFSGFGSQFIVFLLVGYYLIIKEKPFIGWFCFAGSFSAIWRMFISSDYTFIKTNANQYIFAPLWILILSGVGLVFVIKVIIYYKAHKEPEPDYSDFLPTKKVETPTVRRRKQAASSDPDVETVRKAFQGELV